MAREDSERPGGDDPIADKTSWNPLVAGGASFRTRKLVQRSPDRMEFPASVGAWAFAGLFTVLGLAAVAAGITLHTWIPLLAGGIFVILGAGMLWTGTAPVVFDRRVGAFWKGRRAPNEVIRRDQLSHYAPLREIHALQLVSEFIRGSKTSYHSYELNLVLRDGSRLNVTDHGDYPALRRDAETLREFLACLLWDAVHSSTGDGGS